MSPLDSITGVPKLSGLSPVYQREGSGTGEAIGEVVTTGGTVVTGADVGAVGGGPSGSKKVKPPPRRSMVDDPTLNVTS